ncbi:MAG TPA: hypothetical protein VF984_01815 [Actinomycetota bacterium]
MTLHPVPPLDDEEQAPRRAPWLRWVALVVVLAMVIATPFIYVFSRRSREPRSFRVPAGEVLTFAPGVVEPGDTLRCAGGAGAVVPNRGAGVTGFADGPSGGTSIAVRVATDGTVTVRCGL